MRGHSEEIINKIITSKEPPGCLCIFAIIYTLCYPLVANYRNSYWVFEDRKNNTLYNTCYITCDLVAEYRTVSFELNLLTLEKLCKIQF
jgi:hypothetical protein